MGNVDNNSCAEGTVAGGLLGGALGGVLSLKITGSGQFLQVLSAGLYGRLPGGRWLGSVTVPPTGSRIVYIKRVQRNTTTWQPAHASVFNSKQFCPVCFMSTRMDYPEWLGKTLVEQYNSKEKASELIDGGDMSSCWADEIWGKASSG